MEEFNKLVDLLNSKKIVCSSMDWEECIPQDIWDEYFDENFGIAASGLDVDARRWYETSISVIEIRDSRQLLGVRHVSNMFSEQMMVEDCGVTLEFFPMEEYTTVSYKRKNLNK